MLYWAKLLLQTPIRPSFLARCELFFHRSCMLLLIGGFVYTLCSLWTWQMRNKKLSKQVGFWLLLYKSNSNSDQHCRLDEKSRCPILSKIAYYIKRRSINEVLRPSFFLVLFDLSTYLPFPFPFPFYFYLSFYYFLQIQETTF